jgi:sugar transferase EpsL
MTFYPRIKSIADKLVALIILVLLGPLFCLVALLVFWQLGSPIFFRQLRPGFHSKPFLLFKFRTMTNNRQPDGSLLDDNQRLTFFGSFLRSTSIDELPELLNILRGEMSFVGPRPLLMEYIPLYSTDQARRHDVQPGLTGLAQVSGRNKLSWEEKFLLDVWYVDNQCLTLDLQILIRTIWKVLLCEGVTPSGSDFMSPFSSRNC